MFRARMTETTLTGEASAASCEGAALPDALGLVIAWCPGEPHRAGEVCIVPAAREGVSFVLGRGESLPTDPFRRVDFARQRAHLFEPCPPLTSERISRVQLVLQPRGTQAIAARNAGRAGLWHNGERVDEATVVSCVPGDTLRVGRELVLLCVRRRVAGPGRLAATVSMPFGRADDHGLVGESPAAWDLRRRIAFVASPPDHVLVLGESGVGKELAARAIHRLSSRASGPFVARNAATFPDGLVDAELFGHARNYPNAGMPERPGLLGHAEGGTLFLDEIAELPGPLQSHLLRVLDHGDYQRLGDGTPRVSNVRFVAATNRPDALRADLAARFKLTVRVPPLRERAEDVSLLAVSRLRALAEADGRLADRFFGDKGPRLGCIFVEQLVRHPLPTNVRELDAILWDALASSEGDIVEWPASRPTLPAAGREPAEASRTVNPKTLTREGIEAALAAHEGSLEQTWKALGLASRHVLARLMAKHAIRRNSIS
jgi:two-component system nitrogen regulation response regulator GlnG/two-component system response regulator HydG